MNQKLYSAGERQNRPGKYSGRKGHFRWKKQFVLFCSLLVLFLGIAGGTMAYLNAKSGPLENKFTYDKVTCSVNETMNGNEKTNISIQNTSTISAYIRAELIVTWQDDARNVYGQVPVLNEDYTMSDLGSGWISGGDGYYYCTSPVNSNTATPEMFSSIKQIGTNPAPGYTLCVEILADAIQSSPSKAVEEAWGVSVSSGGTISK